MTPSYRFAESGGDSGRLSPEGDDESRTLGRGEGFRPSLARRAREEDDGFWHPKGTVQIVITSMAENISNFKDEKIF